MGREVTQGRFDRFVAFLRQGGPGEAAGNTAQVIQS
jgi:hypothetical protein